MTASAGQIGELDGPELILCDTGDMEQLPVRTPYVATVAQVAVVAGLLDAFNREYGTPTPGEVVLGTRLRRLLAGRQVIAVLTGDPAVGIALLSLRPNVWYDGPVAVLDELYIAPQLRGGGLGTALLKAAEAVVRQRGGELLEINVDGDDIAARRFYERHGYTNHEPGDDQPLLYFYRELDPECRAPCRPCRDSQDLVSGLPGFSRHGPGEQGEVLVDGIRRKAVLPGGAGRP